jgi:hypothetical protein
MYESEKFSIDSKSVVDSFNEYNLESQPQQLSYKWWFMFSNESLLSIVIQTLQYHVLEVT